MIILECVVVKFKISSQGRAFRGKIQNKGAKICIFTCVIRIHADDELSVHLPFAASKNKAFASPGTKTAHRFRFPHLLTKSIYINPIVSVNIFFPLSPPDDPSSPCQNRE